MSLTRNRWSNRGDILGFKMQEYIRMTELSIEIHNLYVLFLKKCIVEMRKADKPVAF